MITNPTTTPILPQKRKLSATDLEIPDSEDDEDYGWAEEDEEDIPPPAPQWQGSEDILVPPEGELEAEDEAEEGEQEEGVDDEGENAKDHTNGAQRGEIEDSEDELAL
jgi:hypothetical protein